MLSDSQEITLKRLAIVSCSLKSKSNSRIMARTAFATALTRAGVEATFLDLRDKPLPMCDGDACYGHPNVAPVREALAPAQAIIVACPIYNQGVNSAAKNLAEMAGRAAWEDKVVGFLCAAGGQSSYMAVLGFANGLMLDFRCLIVPRFVYATGAAFDGEKVINEDVSTRIDQLVDATLKLVAAS